MSRIVISGYYGSKNAGDEAMLAAMLEVLEELDPKLHITVISADPRDTETRHHVASISWLNLPAIAWSLVRADLLLSGGGSLLQNVTSRRSLYYYMGIIAMARLFGARVMLYAQGIGPIEGDLPRRMMRWLGNCVNLITVRDQGSLEELDRLGIKKPSIECTADPVLGIRPVDRQIGASILRDYEVDHTEPIVGISVRDWQGWTHYKKVLAQTADRIVRELHARVVFLPMQYPEDVNAARSIVETMQENCTVLKGDYTTREFLSLVGNMDLMIGIRLHALIFAGVMGVPMIGISYDPKIDRFLASVGEHPAGDLQSVDADALMEEIRQKWHDRDASLAGNARLLVNLRRLATRNAQLAVGLLNK